MPKKACIIITDADAIAWLKYTSGLSNSLSLVETDPQLLADLRLVTDYVFGEYDGPFGLLRDAAARVRALLPQEGGESDTP